MLLVFGALVGIVVAFVAYFFLKGVSEAQHYIFDDLAEGARVRQRAGRGGRFRGRRWRGSWSR